MYSTDSKDIKPNLFSNSSPTSQYPTTLAEIKGPIGIETEADLLLGLLNGILSAVHELSFKNPANLSKADIETLGTQVNILNNYFNDALYIALQSTRIKAGKSAKKGIELGANDPLYAAIIFLASGSTPSIETQNRFKSILTKICKFMDGFSRIAIEKNVSFELTNQTDQCIVMLTSAANFIANKANKFAQLFEENPSVLLIVKELENLSTTSEHDFTLSFENDAEAIAKEQKLAKLRHEHKEKALKLFVQFEKKHKQRIELAAGIQKLYEYFVKDLKLDDYDAQGIATITVTNKYVTEQLSVLKNQFPDDVENGISLHFYKPGFIQGPPINYLIQQQTHALCEVAKNRPFGLRVDEKSIIKNLKIDQAVNKSWLDAMEEVRGELEQQAKEKIEMEIKQEALDPVIIKLINEKFEKLLAESLSYTLTTLYILYAEKFSHQPNTPSYKEFGKLLLHHALNTFPFPSIVTFKEEIHRFTYDRGASFAANDKTISMSYEGDYSDASFRITSEVLRQKNIYFADFVTNNRKIQDLLNLAAFGGEQEIPLQVEKMHLVGDNHCSLLTESQKAYVRLKLDSYPDNRYSKKILSEDFPYGIIKNDGQYFVIYEGFQKNKLLGAGSTAKVKLAQRMDDDQWFTLKVLADEAIAYKELQKLIQLNKTPQKNLFAKQGKSHGKRPGQMKYNILIQYAQGEELQGYLEKNAHQLTDIDLIDIALGMIRAVQKLHQTHFHCDIKLKNFVFKKDVKIIDFGNAVERGITNKLLGLPIRAEIAGTEGHMISSILSDLKRGATHTYYSEKSEIFALACALEQLFSIREHNSHIHEFTFTMKYGKTTYSKGGIGTSTVIPPSSKTVYSSLIDVEHFFIFRKINAVLQLGELTREKDVSLLPMHDSSTFQLPVLTYLGGEIEDLKRIRNEKQTMLKNISWPSCEPLIPDIREADHRINILQVMHDNLLNSLKSSVFEQSGDDKLQQEDYQGAINDYYQALHIRDNKDILFKIVFSKTQLNAYQEAIKDLNAILNAYPNDIDGLTLRGYLYFALADNEKALADLNCVLDIDPDGDALIYRSMVYRILGEVEKAKVDLYRARLLEDNDYSELSVELAAKAFLTFAISEMKKENNNLKKALIYCDEAIYLQRKNRAANQCRAQIYSMMNDHQKAEVDNDPFNVLTIKKRGLDKLAAQDYAGAIDDLSNALLLDPKNTTLLHKRAIAKYRIWNFEGAIKDFNAVIKINAHHSNYFSDRAMTQCMLGQYQEALKDYNEALTLNPEAMPALNERAMIYRMMGEHEKAEEDIQKARLVEEKQGIFFNPYSDYLRCATREVASEHGNPKIALIFSDEALRLLGKKQDPNIHHCRAQIYDRLSDSKNSEIEKKKFKMTLKLSAINKLNSWNNKEAIADCDEVLTLDPNDESVLHNRAVAKSRLGDEQGAIEDHTSSLRLDPNSFETLSARGISKSILGDYQGALVDFNASIDIKPDYALAFYHRGIVLRILGEDKKAEDDMQQFNLLNDIEYISSLKRNVPNQYLKFVERELEKENGNLSAALVYCNEAIRLQHENPELYLYRMKIYKKMGNQKKEKEDRDYGKILTIYPEIHKQLFDAIAEGKKNEVIRYSNLIIKETPSAILKSISPKGIIEPLLLTFSRFNRSKWVNKSLTYNDIISYRDEHYNSALHIAASLGHMEFFDMVVNKKLPEENKSENDSLPLNTKGENPLHSAAISGQIEFLIHAYSIDLIKHHFEDLTANGNTILDLLINNGHIEKLTILLKQCPLLWQIKGIRSTSEEAGQTAMMALMKSYTNQTSTDNNEDKHKVINFGTPGSQFFQPTANTEALSNGSVIFMVVNN